MKRIRHDMVVIRAEVRTVPNAIHQNLIKAWLRELIVNQGMEIIDGPRAAWVGDEQLVGFSLSSLIKTSHCAVHIWNEPDPKVVEFDFYTCGTLDLPKIFMALEPFEPSKIKWWVYNRDDDMVLVDKGVKIIDTVSAKA